MATACSNGIDTGFVDLGTAQAAVLGAVQGIAEILPISATAHMRIMPTFLGWPDPGAAFTAAMQLATLLAVVTFFWRDLWRVTQGAFVAVKSGDYRGFEFRLAVGMIVANVPIVVAGVALRGQFDSCGTTARDLWTIGAASVGMAVLMGLAELVGRRRRAFEDVRLRDAVVIGICQIGALVPGVSRTGSALTAALLMNLTRVEAVRVSFLLGLPVIVGVALRGLLELKRAGLDAHGWQVFGVGLAGATVAAVAAMWLLTKVMERFSIWPFAIYRGLMGAFLLLVVWLDVLA